MDFAGRRSSAFAAATTFTNIGSVRMNSDADTCSVDREKRAPDFLRQRPLGLMVFRFQPSTPKIRLASLAQATAKPIDGR